MNIQSFSALIDYHLQKKQWQTATDLCKQALLSFPDWLEGYQKLGQAYDGLGHSALAIQAYTDSLRINSTQANIYADIAFLYQQGHQFANAIAHYQKALNLKPNWISVVFNLALIYHQLHDWPQAIAYYKQVLNYKHDHVKAWFNLAILYEKLESLDHAEYAYQQVIDIQPEHHRALCNLGHLYCHQDKYSAALVIYHRALDLQINPAEIFSYIGQVYLAQEKIEEAIQAHQNALAFDPVFMQSRLVLGRLWMQHQHFEKAKLCFQLVIEQTPDNIEVNHDLALTHVRLNEWADALVYLRQVTQLQNDFITLFCKRLNDNTPKDSYQKSQIACRHFLQFLEAQDLHACLQSLLLCYRFLGQTLLDYGAPEQAERYLHQALKLDHKQWELYSLLGTSLMPQQRYDAAIAALSTGLIFNPEHPELLTQLAHAQANIKKVNLDHLKTEQQQNITPKHYYHTAHEWIEAIADNLQTQPKFIEIQKATHISCEIGHSPSHDVLHENCGGVTCHHCMKNLIDLFNPKPLGQNIFKCSMTSKADIPSPSTFVIEIPNGEAWIAPQKNEWLICKEIAIMTEDKSVIADLSRFYPWYLPGCLNHQFDQHPRIQAAEAGVPMELEGRVAALSTLSGHVYYHWMIDLLPRIGLLKAGGYDLDTIDTFIVNSLSKSFQKETLETLGIPLEKVIQSDSIPHFTAPNLIVPSFAGDLDWVSPHTIKFLRQTFLRKSHQSEYRRIYISRSRAKYRQVVNETEIITLLKQFGFISLEMESLSVTQQASIFSHAEVIIAPHGAALTNLIFCQPGAQIVELFSPDYLRTDYWMISRQLHLEHYFIKGNGFRGNFLRKLMHQSPLTEDMQISLDSLSLLLQILGVERCR